jgi:cytochrome c oxidase cbb3-type subunit 1
MITFGALYYLVPRLWNRERLYSLRMVNWHFWLATMGIVSTPLDVGLGHHARPDVARIWSGRLPRLFLRRSRRRDVPDVRDPRLGGLLYLSGALIMAYNLWMTIAGMQREEKPMTETPYDPRPRPSPGPGSAE